MGVEKVKASVDAAEKSVTQELQQHAQTVAQHPVVPKQGPAATAVKSTQEAEKSLDNLAKQGEKVTKLVSDPKVTEFLEKREEMLKAADKMDKAADRIETEAKFKEASALKPPTKILEDPGDVKDYSDDLDKQKLERQRKLDEQLIEGAAKKGNISEARKDLLIFGKRLGNAAMDFIKTISFVNHIIDAQKNAKFEERNEQLHDKVVESMAEKKKYMGPAAYAIYTHNPTVIATIDLPGVAPYGELGAFFNGTNSIAIDRGVSEEATARKVLRHEEYHRAAEIAGGSTVRWRDANGDPVVLSALVSRNFLEGLTESFAQQDESKLGNNSFSIAYPASVAAACCLQELIGREALEKAYFTGDFTGVREMVDKKLEEGAFINIISAGDGIAATSLILAFAKSKGIDTSQWYKNPLVMGVKQWLF